MRAGDLISDEIPTLKGSDNVLFAMQLLDEYKMKHLPVVNGQNFLGLLSDEATLETEDYDKPLSEQTGLLQQVFIDKDQHVYDVINLAAEFQLSAIPILDSQMKYVGVISIYCLVRELSKVAAMKERGSVLVLEMNQHDYSLSQIAQIVEGNDSRLLGGFVSESRNDVVQMTLKLSEDNYNEVLQTFRRYGYAIEFGNDEDQFIESLKERSNYLSKYLNI